MIQFAYSHGWSCPHFTHKYSLLSITKKQVKRSDIQLTIPLTHISFQKGISAVKCTEVLLFYDILLSNVQTNCIKDLDFSSTLEKQCL